MDSYLLVDDDAVFGRTLRRFTQKVANLVVVGSKTEALTAMKGVLWAGFLFDVNLGPGEERAGLELLAIARKKYPRVPVAVLTGETDHELTHLVFEAGSLFLRKPFAPAMLLPFFRPKRPSPSFVLEAIVAEFADHYALLPRQRRLLLAAVLGEAKATYIARSNITYGAYRNTVSGILAKTEDETLADLVNRICRKALT